MELRDGSNNFLTSTTTAQDGSYSFPNLLPGYYFVDLVVPANYTLVGQNHIAVTLDCGETEFVHFVLTMTTCPPGMITGRVTGCPCGMGFEGLVLDLLDGGSNYITSDTTDADGYYFFPYGLAPGWLCIPANGEGAGPPFCFLFLSCFGFFFSLLLRI